MLEPLGNFNSNAARGPLKHRLHLENVIGIQKRSAIALGQNPKETTWATLGMEQEPLDILGVRHPCFFSWWIPSSNHVIKHGD